MQPVWAGIRGQVGLQSRDIIAIKSLQRILACESPGKKREDLIN